MRLFRHVADARLVFEEAVPDVLPPEQDVSPEGSSRPVTIDTVVDLPDPFGPSSPRTLPGRSVKLTSRTAGIAE